MNRDMNLLAVPNNNPAIKSQSQGLDIRILGNLRKRNTNQALSENSKRAYERAIVDFNCFISQNNLQVNEETLISYFKSISHLSPATFNQRKYALSKVIKVQFGDTVLKSIALERVLGKIRNYVIDTRIDENEILSELEVKDLIRSTGPKTGAIIKFLFQTGCRVSEMCGIRLSDCERVGKKIKIRIIGKSSKIRSVFIRDSLYREILDAYQGREWLFESRTGKQLNRKNVWKQVQDAGKKIGLDNISPHMLRHARATDMIIQKNISLKAASQYLGHSSTAITLDMYVKDAIDIDDLLNRNLT